MATGAVAREEATRVRIPARAADPEELGQVEVVAACRLPEAARRVVRAGPAWAPARDAVLA